jgi:hypothetical protein
LYINRAPNTTAMRLRKALANARNTGIGNLEHAFSNPENDFPGRRRFGQQRI